MKARRTNAHAMGVPHAADRPDGDRRDELESVTEARIAFGDGADLSSGSALDVRDGKDYILCLTQSQRWNREVRLVGGPIVTYRKGNRIGARLGGLSAFWGWL